MIDYDEYIGAGFTPDQARLLVARDRRCIDDRFELLHGALNRGFADVLASMSRLTDQVADSFDHMDERLDRIEQRFQAPPEASG
jgi:hypothetical protein